MKLLILCLVFGAVLALTDAVPAGENVSKEITNPESVGEADLSEADPPEDKANKETDESDPEAETDLSEETDEADAPDETDLSEEDDSLPDDVKEAEDAENGLRVKRWSKSTCRKNCAGRCWRRCRWSCKRRCRRKWWWRRRRCRRRCRRSCRRGCSGRCRSRCARLLPNRWYRRGKRSYMYVNHKYHWAQAQKHCTDNGATLASVQSRAEDRFLRRLSHKQPAWIGMFDSSYETWWLWVSGEPRGYSNFCRGQPNNRGKAQHCAYINFKRKFCWNDERCHYGRHFICQRK